MCGRYSLTRKMYELEQRFVVKYEPEDLEAYRPLPVYNVAPTDIMPVITSRKPQQFSPMRWGYIPFWAKNAGIGASRINARIETVQEKYKKSMETYRCVVPMDSFYEWVGVGKKKIPYRIQASDQDIFACAGLWGSWKSPDGNKIRSFTIITQDPSESIAHIHDRMPAMLEADQIAHWLDETIPPSEVLDIIQPYPDNLLSYYTVSMRVNSVRNNDAELIQPVQYPELENDQMELF